MTDILPVALAGATLLVSAGAPKVADPKPLVRAVRTAGLPFGPATVRAFAAAEVLSGIAAVVWPGRLTGGLLAAMYGLFSAFVAIALARGGVLESCGCFGQADTPPTRSHLAVTILFVLAGLALVAAPPASPWWRAGLGEVAGTVALTALLSLLAWAVMAVLPTVTPQAIRSTGTAEPGGSSGVIPSRRGSTFALTRPAPARLPDPTFPPLPQKG